MNAEQQKVSGFRLSWFFIAVFTLSVLQLLFSLFNLQKTIGLNKEARQTEIEASLARQTLGDVHYSVYKILGTMDPYQMDQFKGEYNESIESLIDQCSKIDISAKQTLPLKEVYDSIVTLHYQFAVNIAKNKMNTTAREQYDSLAFKIERMNSIISSTTDKQIENTVLTSSVSITLLQIFMLVTIAIMGLYYTKSIEAKRAADRQIKDAHKSLTNVLDSARQVAIISFNEVGTISLFNKGAVEMLGINEDSVKNSNILHFMDPQEIFTLSYELEKTLGYSVSGVDALIKRITPDHPFQSYMTFIDNNGRRINVELNVTVSYDENTKSKTFLAVAKNVTDRLAAEEALRQQEENLRTTLNSIGDAVIATDASGNITRMNPVAEKITGWTFQEAKGKKLLDVFNIINRDSRLPHPDPISKVLKTNSIINLENDTVLISKDNREIAVADSGAPIIGHNNEIRGVVLVFRDITEEQKTEEQLRQSQKMDAIGQLAGGVAHDFNNMLSGILSAAELLKASGKTDENNSELVDLIIDASEKASGLTKQLLSFGRKNRSNMIELDIHTIIHNSITLLERSIDKRITVHRKLEAEKHIITGDSSQLQNVFINLGINARDAMPEGGELLYTSKAVTLDWVFCDSTPFNIHPGRYICIEVKDSGKGMSVEVQKRIFEPFFTTKEIGKGTGLGLAAVYGTILDHKGAINVYSEEGKGTSFHIYLPLEHSDSVSNKSEIRSVKGGKGTILLIDDEDIVRNTAELSLKHLGFEVITAVDGEDGVIKFTKYQNRIDVVVLDMIMPKLNGEECFQKICEIDPTVKVLFCSGFTRDISVKELQSEGPHLFIQKPYSLSELSEKLLELLNLAT